MLSGMTESTSLKRRLLVAVAALSLFAASCGGGSSNDTSTTATESADAPVAEQEVAEASLVASTVNGEQIDFGSLEGQDVVLWFWAPW